MAESFVKLTDVCSRLRIVAQLGFFIEINTRFKASERQDGHPRGPRLLTTEIEVRVGTEVNEVPQQQRPVLCAMVANITTIAALDVLMASDVHWGQHACGRIAWSNITLMSFDIGPSVGIENTLPS